jgi:two-component system sensor histidine kinase TctE
MQMTALQTVLHADKRRGRSLKQRLLVRLGALLFIALTLGAFGAFMLARHMGAIVYDSWLYDSAMTLASQIRFTDQRPVLELPNPAIQMFEWDTVDHIYEEVVSRKTGRIFGNTVFREPPIELGLKKPYYYDDIINNQLVRSVAVLLPNPTDNNDAILVQVAETRHKRAGLAMSAMLMSLPLQIAIFLLASAFVWMAVQSSLHGLADIAGRLEGYDAESLVPVGDADNTPLEVKPLVRSLNLLIDKLSQGQNTQRRFVSNAAHQLRTPLAILQVQTERALREQDPKLHSEALSRVLRALTRLRRVVHQLLILARSDRTDEVALKMVPIDLAELARDELEQWADAAIARGIDLGYDGPENGVEIIGEPSLLHELIGNLVDNAIRYGGAGGRVTLGLSATPLILYVEDNGEGIPPEERALVLERFYRRSDSAGDGCGLGLPIAREITERHRARLSILDNPRSNGTRIEIAFPARDS